MVDATLPTIDELKKLPLLAIVAYAVRCARRVQPLYGLAQGIPHRQKHEAALETALQIGEQFCRGEPLVAGSTARAAYAAADAAAYAARSAYDAVQAAHVGDATGDDAARAAYVTDDAARAAYAAAHFANHASSAAYSAQVAAAYAAAASRAAYGADHAARSAARPLTPPPAPTTNASPRCNWATRARWARCSTPAKRARSVPGGPKVPRLGAPPIPRKGAIRREICSVGVGWSSRFSVLGGPRPPKRPR